VIRLEEQIFKLGRRSLAPAILTAIMLVIAGMAAVTGCGNDTTVDSTQETATKTDIANTTPGVTPGAYSFELPKKSAHYETNTPAHEAVLAGVPINVVIDFNFDLAPPSSISIMSNGKEYATGDTVIDESLLALRRPMAPDAPDGLYTVNYNACWPDGSCHDGHFQFAIDRSSTAGFTDMRSTAEVKVAMADISFSPRDVRISRSTRVTWQNNDDTVHYVNTDPHPAHTYYPPQNSRGLNKGETFSVVFDQPGIYPYHCSAHAGIMTGNILVD
jgi:plastocyanin